MSDFNEKFRKLTGDFPYLRFISAKVDTDRLKVTVTAVYKKEYEKELSRSRDIITDKLKKLLPPSVRIELVTSPVSGTSSEVLKYTMELLHKESIFVFSSVSKDDIRITTGDNASVTITLSDAIADYAESEKLDEKLKAYLAARMFMAFDVRFIRKAEDVDAIRETLTAVPYKPKFSYERPDEGRRISPPGRTQGYGEVVTGDARYICDCIRPDFAVLYGMISDVRVMEYTPKKPKDGEDKRKFVTFFLDDSTGRIRCVFFPSAKNQGALKFIEKDAYIIADGWLDMDARLNDGSLQFRVRRFSPCERASFEVNKVVRLPDDDYRFVRPQPYVELEQSSLYSGKREPRTDDPIVIFAIMTDSQNKYVPGEMIEIGAVKLKDGRIAETFHSLVCPRTKVSEEALHAVGLTATDIAGRPTYDEVLPDFYKFFDGYMLAAFPRERNFTLLGGYLEKLHIPMPTEADLTRYASVADFKKARPKSPRVMPAVQAYAEILTNIR